MDDWETREGETPYEDIDGFKPTKKYPHPSRQLVDELEEENIRKATLKYLASRPSEKKARFDYDWFLQLHKEMYGNVWTWAGIPRQSNSNIGIDKHQIRDAVAALQGDLQSWAEHNDDPLEIAMMLHHRAVVIHPFKNGNGRWSRLLANIWLKQNHHSLTVWPIITEESPIRDAYLDAVRKADDMDYAPLLALHKQHTDT